MMTVPHGTPIRFDGLHIQKYRPQANGQTYRILITESDHVSLRNFQGDGLTWPQSPEKNAAEESSLLYRLFKKNWTLTGHANKMTGLSHAISKAVEDAVLGIATTGVKARFEEIIQALGAEGQKEYRQGFFKMHVRYHLGNAIDGLTMAEGDRENLKAGLGNTEALTISQKARDSVFHEPGIVIQFKVPKKET